MCLESYDKEIDNYLFKTYQKRLSSFKKWTGKLNPEELASSGFYYTSIDDVCKCFYCGVEIFKWKSDDCPIIEHYRLSKYCDFVECLWHTKYNKYQQINKNNPSMILKVDKCIILIFVILLILNIVKVCFSSI